MITFFGGRNIYSGKQLFICLIDLKNLACLITFDDFTL